MPSCLVNISSDGLQCEFDSHTTTMIIINKITGRDVSSEYLALMKGIITSDEFELITLTIWD